MSNLPAGLRLRLPGWLAGALVVAIFGTWCAAQGRAGAGAGDVEKEAPTMSMLELFMKGGKFMIPILLCSLAGLAIVIERLLSLRRSKIVPPGFLDGLRSVFTHAAEDRDRGLQYCHANGSPVARVLAAGISKMHKDEETVERAIEDAGANEIAKLKRNLRALYAVAAIAPLLGLLGTVSGMILAFQVASVKGLGRASALAQGIYEALVTTYAGLLVAIPAMVFYYYFLGKIDRVVSDMNDVSIEFMEHYVSGRDRARGN